ncbi:MAG: glycosyltransferase family 4 protein [Planctomycetota bacterium]|jgi:glycosyltransferase involved in cell wall biosynthesis
MKIVFVLPGISNRAGGIKSTLIAANQLLARGHKVRILYRSMSVTMRSMLRYVRNNLIYSNRCDWLEKFKGSVTGFRDITECQFAPDEIVVGVGMWGSGELGRLSFIPNPKVQYLRGLTPRQPQLMDAAMSLSLPKIAVSSRVAEVAESYGSNNLLAVIPNGIDQAEYYPSVDENSKDGIGTIYSRHPIKDPGTVLKVLDKLREDIPRMPHYIFGTAPKPKQIPRADYTRYPSVEEARRKYSRSMVWILASRSEGFPAPVLEAMACGCAVVSTDCGGPQDMIINGENGFLVEVGNVDQIVSRVKLLSHNVDLRRKFVERSKETVKSFTWKRSVDKLEEVLRSITPANQ